MTYELVLATGDVGDVHVVSGWGQIFHLLSGEDVDGSQVDLGVTVLSSLGGGHVNDLARAALDDNVTVLPQSRALHGEGGGGASIGGVEGVLMLFRRAKLATAICFRARVRSRRCISYCGDLAHNDDWNIPGHRPC